MNSPFLPKEEKQLSPSQFTGYDGTFEFLLAQGAIFPFGNHLCVFIDLERGRSTK